MKIICLLLFFTCAISHSQSLEKIQKKYHLEHCAKSNYLIVSRKGKSGIYDQKKELFVLELSESKFIYLEKFEILFEFTSSNEVIIRDLFSPDFPDNYLVSAAENYFMFQKETYYDNRLGDYYYSQDKLHQENSYTGRIKPIIDSSTIISDKIKAIPDYVKMTFGVERKNDFVIITDLQNDSYNPNPTPFQSIFGYDSINDFGEVVYPEFEGDKGYQATGVYDLSKRDWIIQPEYFRVLLLNDVIFCNKQDPFNDEYYYPGYGHWDIFKIENEKIQSVKSDVFWASEIPLDKIFKGDSFDFVQKDSSYIQFEKGGKKGLMRLSLFYNSDYLNPGEPAYSSLSLYHDTLLQPKYKLIANIGSDLIQPEYMLLDEKGITYVNLSGDNLLSTISANKKISIRDYGVYGYDLPEFKNWVIDGNTYRQVNNDSLELISEIIENPTEKRLLSRRSMEILNDSLIYVEYWIKQGTYWEAVHDYDSYEYEMSESGDQLFYPPEPGEFKSGIFNLKTDQWLYDREYAWISKSCDNFFISYPKLDSVGYYKTYLFQVDNFNLETIEKEAETGTLKMDFIDLLPQYRADTIYSIFGEAGGSLGYFDVKDKIGMYYKFYPEIILHPRDYTFYKDEFKFYLTLQNDSCWLKMGDFDSTISVNTFDTFRMLPAQNINPYYGDLYLQISHGKNNEIIHVKNQDQHKSLHFSKDDFDAYLVQEKATLNWGFSMSKFNDSLLYIEDWLGDEKYSEIAPIASLEYPGEDSINNFGEYVYPPLKGGYNRSGVYNLKSKSWFLDREYYKIDFTEGQFLLRKPVRSVSGLIEYFQFRIINLNNEIIWDGKGDNELPDESPFFRTFLDN